MGSTFGSASLPSRQGDRLRRAVHDLPEEVDDEAIDCLDYGCIICLVLASKHRQDRLKRWPRSPGHAFRHWRMATSTSM